MERGLIALGAALAIAVAAGAAAIGIGIASGKAFEASARQPEISGKIQATLVVSLLLVFAF